MKRKEVITTVKKMVVCLAIPLTMSLACGSTTVLAQTTPKSTAITLAQSVATTAPSPITNRQRSAKVTIIKPGTYRVQATLLGKTYTLNKTVTVPEIDYSTRW